MQDHGIAKAFENLEVLSHNPKNRAEYEARKKALLDINNGMYVNRLEGRAEGGRGVSVVGSGFGNGGGGSFAPNKVALYLAPKATMIQLIINPGMIDRRSRGPLRPCASQGRHALLRNEPEQLRGPLSPYHARPGHQGGRDDEYSGLCRD